MRTGILLGIFQLVLLIGCGRIDSGDLQGSSDSDKDLKKAGTKTTLQTAAPEPMRMVLIPLGGDTALDRRIAQVQQQLRSTITQASLEQLGWLFVSKARASFDPGFYKLAEQCALCMDLKQPHSPEALLLRGHVLQSLHHFKEAEALARELVTRRGLAFEFGLLGDALMEQGRLNEAVEAYQKMIDIKPDLQSYARAAHMRWLKGDLDGAIEVLHLAVQSATPRDAESAAWVNTKMAWYQLQAGALEKSRQFCEIALQFQESYPPALLVLGRIALAGGKNDEAIESLSRAAELNPLPEYQWTLADALRAANRVSEAQAVEHKLRAHGAAADPRTFALYLATRGEDTGTALQLSRAELETRADIFTRDALAWSLVVSGDSTNAESQMARALAEGTKDARLFLHACVVAERLSRSTEAETFFCQASALQQMLLPSEREQLRVLERQLHSTTSRVTKAALGPARIQAGQQRTGLPK